MISQRLQSLADETKAVSDLFKFSDKSLYLVGGVVRDAVLNRLGEEKDLDFTTDASPDEIETIVSSWADAVWTQGKRFGTIGAKKDGRLYEITTHRAEVYRPDSRNPQVDFSTDIEADLSRRDFTVNAMALKLPEMQLIDPFGGVQDIAQRVLRTPKSAEQSFMDDPLRMLRAARFIAGYDLVPTEDLVDAVITLRDRISIVSAERIRDEINKLIVVTSPSDGLWFLVKTGLADQFLPELSGLALEQDPIHRHKDVLGHTIAVVEKASPDRILRLAALFHDIGKPRTRKITNSGVSFHHHEVVGARMTRERMRVLRFPTEEIEQVSNLVFLHLRFHTYSMGWTDSAIRRYVKDAGDQLDQLNELTRCDCTTRNKAKADALSKRMDELEAKIVALKEKEELDSMRPDLDGQEVMSFLNIQPGPQVGKALNYLLQLRLDEGPLGQDEASRRLKLWWEDQNL